jgi:N6-adenosine-specific RNA methylase IME4
MRDEITALAGHRFPCVCADPAWKFRTWDRKKTTRSVENHYRTMPLDELRDLPVCDLAAKNAHLFLWVTGPFLDEGIQMMRRWGFRYSAIAFVWVKMRRALEGRQLRFIPADADDFHVGMGFTTRKNTELCLLGRRGSPIRLRKDIRELIVAPVREHSRKPDEFYRRVELYAHGPYLDLFSRIERPGWTTIGDQTGRFKYGSESQQDSQSAPANGARPA